VAVTRTAVAPTPNVVPDTTDDHIADTPTLSLALNENETAAVLAPTSVDTVTSWQDTTGAKISRSQAGPAQPVGHWHPQELFAYAQ